MPNHICPTCKRAFNQKGHLQSHFKRKKPCVSPSIRYVDLFAGIGGFRYGIEAFAKGKPYTFQCIKTVDLKKDALKTYNLAFQESVQPTDIRDVKNLGPFDLLCAGFPCQPFSSAGKKEGLQDETRGDLIYEVVRICKESQPTFLLLENVSNIELLENGTVLKTIIEEFTKIGYHMTTVSVNALDVGLAQDRKRIFLVGSRKGPVSISISPKPHQVIRDILDTTDTVSHLPQSFVERLRSVPNLEGKSLKDKRGGADNIHSWDLAYHGPVSESQKNLLNELLKQRRKKCWATSKGIGWSDGMPLTLKEIQTFQKYDSLQTDLDDLVQKGYLVLEHPKDRIDGKRVERTDSPKGYNITKGKLSFPLSKILHPDHVAPTLTATDSSKLGVIVGSTIRQLNGKELKKLCGFPDEMPIVASVNLYDLFGNMVCPPVITELLSFLFPQNGV